MAKKLSPHDVEFLGSIIDSTAETINECSKDRSNPFMQEFGKKLSYIQDAFIMQKFDAETYLNKLDEASKGETHFELNATFRGIMFDDYEQAKKQLHLGSAFDGEPAHPEHFDICRIEDGDKFAGTENVDQYTFKYQCPKIGGQKFSFRYSTDKTDEDGQLWIELNGSAFKEFNRAFGEHDERFELRQIEDGELYVMRSNGILLDGLLSLGTTNDYELAFTDGYIDDNNDFVDYNGNKPLTKEEINVFKKYIHAFEEAIKGEGKYTQELEEIAAQQPQGSSTEKQGCLGMFLIPIIAIGGLLMTIL